jgi:tripartite-type tricarboxylate transporter receptor subunit TctC
LPEVPTFTEAGVKDVVVSNWFGLMAPPGLPATIVTRLQAETVKALQTPDMREKFAAMALEIVANRPDEFRRMVEAEVVRWGTVVKQAGIQPE